MQQRCMATVSSPILRPLVRSRLMSLIVDDEKVRSVGFEGPYVIATGKTTTGSTFMMAKRTGHNDLGELLKRGSPSMLILSSNTLV